MAFEISGICPASGSLPSDRGGAACQFKENILFGIPTMSKYYLTLLFMRVSTSVKTGQKLVFCKGIKSIRQEAE